MATFRNAAIRWADSDVVHIVSDSVHERSAKFVLCAARIGANPVYDGEFKTSVSRAAFGASLAFGFEKLVPSCPVCMERERRVCAPREWVTPPSTEVR